MTPAARVLVTGGNGTIGRRVCSLLRLAGREVLAPRSLELNLLDRSAVEAYLAAWKPEAVIHLAWVPTAGDYANDPANVDWAAATLNLALTVAGHGASVFVGAGTCAESPSPLPPSLYAHTKAAVRDVLLSWAEHAAMRVVWGRIFYAYAEDGPRHKLFCAAAAAFARGDDFTLTHPDDRYDWIHADDLAGAMVTLCAAEKSASYDIGWGASIRTGDAIAQLRAIMAPRKHRDAASAPNVSGIHAMELRANDRRLRELGWEPRVSLEQGLRRVASAALAAEL